MICKIADFVVEFINPSKQFEDFVKDYSHNGAPQVQFSITEEDLQKVRSTVNYPACELQLELTAFYDKFLAWLPLQDSFFLHASLIEANSQGVAFTALSGTGKSTHTALWKKLLGDNMQVINGDKPIIRFINNVPYGYGTPWNGKEHWGINGKVAVNHLCFIERAKTNSCEKMTAKQTLEHIFSQIFIPNDPLAAANTLSLLDRLLNSCCIWNIKCNTELEAAKIAYNTIFKENQNEA